MNYKDKLQENNTNLQAILDLVNNMPEGGGGSSGGGEGAIETCQVDVLYNPAMLGEFPLTCLFTELGHDGKPFVSCSWLVFDRNNTIQTLTLLKNSVFIHFTGAGTIYSPETSADNWIDKISEANGEIEIYHITEDTTINLN